MCAAIHPSTDNEPYRFKPKLPKLLKSRIETWQVPPLHPFFLVDFLPLTGKCLRAHRQGLLCMVCPVLSILQQEEIF